MSQQTPNLAAQLADVRVGVRPELEVSRHVFGGEPAYVVIDPVSFQSHRFSEHDYQVFVAIHDRQKLGSLLAELTARGVIEDDQEEEFYAFILSLTQRGLLNLPLSDGGRLFKRFEEKRQAKRKNRLMSSLFLRVPLVKPDRFLNCTVHLVRPLFTRAAFALWCAALLASLAVVFSRWDEVTSPMASILAVGNIPVLWTLLVVLKVVHELGHAYACKRFGGQVPEMGAYLIMLTPCAYVDASASWGFPSRWQRVVVALAGMYFESIAAMFALAVWVATPPGTLHDAAHYAVVLSTVVTIAFNANPLMRYDGYYVLSDALGIPNLRAEADRCLRSWASWLLYGVKRAESGRGRLHGAGMAAFGVAGALYKVTLLLGISLVIAQKLPLVGFGVAALYFLQTVKQSGLSLTNYLRFSDDLADRRRRATGVTALCAAALLLAVCLLPMPAGVEAVGVVTRQEELTVRAGAPGFVREVLVDSGDAVSADDMLCRLENIDIEAEAERLAAQSAALGVEWKRAIFEDRTTAARTEARRAEVVEDQKIAEERLQQLSVRAPRRGEVTGIDQTRVGMFVGKGDPIAVVGAGPWTVRTLLTSEQMVDARLAVDAPVLLRMIGLPGEVVEGRVLTVAAQGRKKVDQEELTHLAGGEIAVDPSTGEATNSLFEVTIAIGEGDHGWLRTGSTAQVAFDGERTTLLRYLCRRGLQLLHDLQTQT
ncbi:MAG: site-2 protease family protein [Planctomycetota bacterium]